MSGTYQDLKVWQASMDLVVVFYQLTGKFPKEELYGLVSQMRRASVSIPSNIAEGKGRNSKKELGHFLANSRGSLHELETQLILARRLGYIDKPHADELQRSIAEVGRMLSGFMSFASGA